MEYYSTLNIQTLKEEWSAHFFNFFKIYCPKLFYNRLGYNKNISIKIIYKLLESNISELQKLNLCTYIASNCNITYKDYEILTEKYHVQFNNIDLVHNINLPLEFFKNKRIIERAPLLFFLYGNNNIDIDFIKTKDDIMELDLNWNILTSKCPKITCQDILNNPQLPWDFSSIYLKKGLTNDLVIEFAHLINFPFLHRRNIIRNRGINMDKFIKYLIEKNKENINNEKNINNENKIIKRNLFKITKEYLVDNINDDWNFEFISNHSCVDLELFEKYPDKPWNPVKVMSNKNIKLVDIIDILENKLSINIIKGKYVVEFKQKFNSCIDNYQIMQGITANPNNNISIVDI